MTDPELPEKTRKPFQFSLKTMFVITVMTALILGIWVESARQQRKVVDWALENGATVIYENGRSESQLAIPSDVNSSWKWIPLPISWKTGILIDMEWNIVYFESRNLLSSYPKKSSVFLEDIEPLRKLSDLETVSIAHSNITDISPLTEHTRIKNLTLSHSKISDLAPLENLTQLENLFADSTSIEDISALKKLKNLTDLDLSATEVSDISVLSELRSLEYVNLSFTNVDDISPF